MLNRFDMNNEGERKGINKICNGYEYLSRTKIELKRPKEKVDAKVKSKGGLEHW